MSLALGRDDNDEYKPLLSNLSSYIKGNCGLMFTDSPAHDFVSYCESNQVDEYARTGFKSEIEFRIPNGPIDLPFSMEPQLRQLGLDTKLNKGRHSRSSIRCAPIWMIDCLGVIELLCEHQVCRECDILTPEQCRLLKLFGQKLATFKIDVVHTWSNPDCSSNMEIQN